MMNQGNYFKVDGVWHCRRGTDVLKQVPVIRDVTGRNGSCVKVTGVSWVLTSLLPQKEKPHALA